MTRFPSIVSGTIYLIFFLIIIKCQSPVRGNTKVAQADKKENTINSNRNSETENVQAKTIDPVKDIKTSEIPNPTKDNLNPDQVHLLAKLIKILPVSKDAVDFPCNQYSCWGEIEVLEIIARGRTYAGNATAGQHLRVYFPMTLLPSKEVFKEASAFNYDGLSVGVHFNAFLTAQESVDSPEIIQHTIDQYTTLK